MATHGTAADASLAHLDGPALAQALEERMHAGYWAAGPAAQLRLGGGLGPRD